jgi:hypothetical protein
MRLALPLIALLPASLAAEVPAPTMAPSLVVPLAPDAPLGLQQGRVPCRDTIHQVRRERGLPEIQRETASPEEPLLIAAVDHRINGCSVMVMHGNTSDVRPLPALPEGPAKLERIPRG